MIKNSKIAIFQKKEIRKIIYENEWWFSVIDVCSVLTDSRDAGAYWRKLKQRLKSEGSEVVTNCHGLKLEASVLLKITIYSPRKAKKRWLMANPNLVIKGYGI